MVEFSPFDNEDVIVRGAFQSLGNDFSDSFVILAGAMAYDAIRPRLRLLAARRQYGCAGALLRMRNTRAILTVFTFATARSVLHPLASPHPPLRRFSLRHPPIARPDFSPRSPSQNLQATFSPGNAPIAHAAPCARIADRR